MTDAFVSRLVCFKCVLLAAGLILALGCSAASDKSSSEKAAGDKGERRDAAASPPTTKPAGEAGENVPPQVELPAIDTPPPSSPSAEAAAKKSPPPGKPAAPPRPEPADPSGTTTNPLRGPSDPPPPGETPPGESKPGPVKPRLVRPTGFDPIKENGPIFVGWPPPKVAIIVTGREDGYLEPCGCAGLERMKGGLSRRHTLFKTLRACGWPEPFKGSAAQCASAGAKGWPVVGVDVGALGKGFGRQAELKFQTTVEAMRKIGYDAIALAAGDLQLPAGYMIESPFLSANVAMFGFKAGVTAKQRIVTAGGVKLGITAVLGAQYRKQIHNDDVEIADPADALKDVVPELKKQADYLILLAHAGVEESVALAKQFPDFDLVVTAGGGAEPPLQPTPIEGTHAMLVEVGEKGMNAVVVGLYGDPKKTRYQRVPLDSRFEPSPDMKMLMTAYQEQLKEEGFDKLNIRPVPHPLKEISGNFIGSQKCQSCHEESYRVWKKSRHSQAYETLANLDPPRNFDPECISCHVVGWNPQNYFYYEGGYQSAKKTPQLKEVGCEDCHGPGSAHAAAEEGANLELQKKLQQPQIITKAEAADPKSKKQNCYTCHDLDNSPDFKFDTYWPEVEHYEKNK